MAGSKSKQAIYLLHDARTNHLSIDLKLPPTKQGEETEENVKVILFLLKLL